MIESDVDHILAETMMYLLETAAADGIITEEESKVIEEIDFSLKYYKNMLVRALKDGIITEEERSTLNKIKERIIQEGFNVAEQINGVSKDELNLLLSVMVSLKIPDATRCLH